MNNDETRRILDMLAQGKITVEEAQKLMSAVNEPESQPGGPTPRFLRITVTEAPNDSKPKGKTVNIRVPLSIIRGGFKLGSLVPGLSERFSARAGANLDFSKLDAADLERTLKDLNDVTIGVDKGAKHVQFHCE